MIFTSGEVALATDGLDDALCETINLYKGDRETNYGAKWDHSVLIYSVTYTTAMPTLDAVYTMNMGWRGLFTKKPEYKASASWFYACGYMEDYSVTHTLGRWTDADSCYHIRECSDCDYSESSMHADSWDSNRKRCLKCTRTGYYEVALG